MSQQIENTGYEYETLMSMLHVSVSKHLLDEHFTVIWANDYYFEMIGYTKEEYEATYHNKCDLYYVNSELGVDDSEEWNKIGKLVIDSIKEGKTSYQHTGRMRRKDGEYIWVRMTGTFTGEYVDGYRVAYTVMTDISDIIQMRMEQSITYNSLPGFVGKYKIDKTLNFTLLEANDQFVRFFGENTWKNSEDSLFRENFSRNLSAIEEWKDKLLMGEPAHFTMHMKGQDGTELWLQVNATCVDWQNDCPVYLAIFIDVTNETELRQMQKQLEQQAEELRMALHHAEDANREKSNFLSRMSHDIRTPMNAIIGMTDIAAAHLHEPEKLEDCLKKISLSSQHLLGLINDVLDMSKIESGKMALRNDVVSLPEVIEKVVAIMQPQFKERSQWFSIRLHQVVHEQLFSDALRLRQVFVNILSNASKFTPSGGKITVDVTENQGDDPNTALFTFVFADTGIGMEPEFLTHIFDAFSRERDSRVDKTEGTGLGMAITKRIVELLNGTIQVKSERGKGTTFTIQLPITIEDTSAEGKKFPELRILIADDDAIMCEYSMGVLRSLGIHVDCVNSGEKALEQIVHACQNKEKGYDAVILDWKMPGLDGMQTARRLRKVMGDRLPILICSAYDWDDIEDEAKEAGVNGFISKPMFISTICHTLERYVLKKQGKAETPKDKGTDFSGKRFLLVEDNELNREVATELLLDTGVIIDTAENGKQGVETFAASKEGAYDLILMDVQMPVMDGYTATKQIRGLSRKDALTVPILAMTADAFAEDIAAAKQAGMNGHLAKPLDQATLKREIQKYLNGATF